MFYIGDKVKVIDQDITGTIVGYDCGSKVVILDDNADEWAECDEDRTLVYSQTDLKLIN